MSSEDKLTFPCPACQSTLKVPAHLAGVRGPCPQCGTEIVAPNPAFHSGAHMAGAAQFAGVAAGPALAVSQSAGGYGGSPAPRAESVQGVHGAAAYNPWQPDASTGQHGAAHGELNLGAALAAPPMPAAQAQASPPMDSAGMWAPQPAGQMTMAPPSLPSFATTPRMPDSPPVNPFAAGAAAPGFGGPGDPFAAPTGGPGFPAATVPAEPVFGGPSLFPTSAAPARAQAGDALPKGNGPQRVRKRRIEREPGMNRKSARVLAAVGGVALVAGGAFFLIPGLKDKLLGKSKPLDVTVDTAIPVPRKPAVAAGAAKDPGGSGAGETGGAPQPAPASAVLPIDPEAARKPAPDFGLGDPPAAPAPTESPEAPTVPPQEPAGETLPTPARDEIAEKSTPAPSSGDAVASPEDVAAARTILENFIRATTIEERLSYSQPAPGIEEQMRAYYAKHPSPIAPVQINYTLANILEGSTKRFFVFEVTTDRQQQGFPVAVEETDQGLKVDWRSFVEFHDNMLGRFLSVYRQGPESFRVILERAHYFKTDVPNLGGKLAFRIKPPAPGFEGFAFCPKDTSIGEDLDRKFAWDVKYLPIVELEWVKDEKGAKYIRVVRVIQDNWRAVK